MFVCLSIIIFTSLSFLQQIEWLGCVWCFVCLSVSKETSSVPSFPADQGV